MVPLFLERHDQYFMFKDSNVFVFANFLFKTKYDNTVVYSVNSNCLFPRGKLFDQIYRVFINILPKFDDL